MPEQVIAHTNLYWSYHEAPGRTAGTTTAAEFLAEGPVGGAGEPASAGA